MQSETERNSGTPPLIFDRFAAFYDGDYRNYDDDLDASPGDRGGGDSWATTLPGTPPPIEWQPYLTEVGFTKAGTGLAKVSRAGAR